MAPSDAPLLVGWGSEDEFRYYQWGRRPGVFDDATARSWIERMSRPGDAACWVIEHEGRPIGFANYRDLRLKAKSVQIGIGIGDKTLWGRHLGREALALEVRHLLVDLGLHRVELSVLSHNDRAIWMYKALGFQVEGVERDAVGVDDGYADDIKMALVVGLPRPAFDPRPVTLEGRHVRLVPLRMEHVRPLFEVGDEDDVWRWVAPRPDGLEGYTRYVRWALDQQVLGGQLPFAVTRAADGLVVGTTRYAHIDPPDRTIEIGYTFYGKGARRTAVNTESKYLLMRHAFETLEAQRVWLQTSSRNERSQRAIERIGARREGTLRNERLLPDGSPRDSVIFSVIAAEWPEVRDRLLGLLAR